MDDNDLFINIENLEVNSLYYVSSPHADFAIWDGKKFCLPSERLGQLVFKEDNYYGVDGGRVKPLVYLNVNVGFGFRNQVVLDLVNFINSHIDRSQLSIPSHDEIKGV